MLRTIPKLTKFPKLTKLPKFTKFPKLTKFTKLQIFPQTNKKSHLIEGFLGEGVWGAAQHTKRM